MSADIFDPGHYCRECNNPNPEQTFERLVWVNGEGDWRDAEGEDLSKRLARRTYAVTGEAYQTNGGGVFYCTDCGAVVHGVEL